MTAGTGGANNVIFRKFRHTFNLPLQSTILFLNSLFLDFLFLFILFLFSPGNFIRGYHYRKLHTPHHQHLHLCISKVLTLLHEVCDSVKYCNTVPHWCENGNLVCTLFHIRPERLEILQRNFKTLIKILIQMF